MYSRKLSILLWAVLNVLVSGSSTEAMVTVRPLPLGFIVSVCAAPDIWHGTLTVGRGSRSGVSSLGLSSERLGSSGFFLRNLSLTFLPRDFSLAQSFLTRPMILSTTQSTALFTGRAIFWKISLTLLAMPPMPRIAASAPMRTGIERASASSILAATPPVLPFEMAMIASSTELMNSMIWRPLVMMNRTMSMIILQARMNADAGLNRDTIQVMPAMMIVGSRYSTMLPIRSFFRSPTRVLRSSHM